MVDFSDIAVNNFKQGYNCAQSVFLTFADECNLDKETALKISSSFGGGMGRLREVCGAVTSMFAIAGIKKGYISPIDDIEKAKHYALIQHLSNEFKKEHDTIICRELLGLPDGADESTPSKRTQQYYEERPCELFIKTAVKIIEKELLK